ncbi:MAG TPA: tRNA (adenine(22)-N(1))-methyltransferase TrmK, partial [Ureibacillus sp.]|nr:tRNA (adenine(22)-N(1))-methyltransferase TrmK [Ureibacillus sp.]
TRLILQPNIHAKVIREWAMRNNWAILDEVILKEDDKIYEILVLQRGEMSLSEQEILLGANLMANKNEVFIEKWSKEIDNWKRILTSIDRAEDSKEIVQKRQDLNYLIKLVEGALNNEER